MNCYKDCKFNYYGFCTRYNEEILVSTHPLSKGLLIHPYYYLTTYYDKNPNQNTQFLIEVAQKYSSDEVVKNICEYYNKKNYISLKQQKYIVYSLLNNCFEQK